MTNLITSIAITMAIFSGLFDAAGAQELNIREAEAIAVQKKDPSVTRFLSRAAALTEKAVADSQLPDPKLRAGLLNLPVDTFRFNQEPMTQVRIGLQQQFPAGRTRHILGQRRLSEADTETAKAILRQQEIIRDTRMRWLELYHWLEANRLVMANRDAVGELLSVAKSTFATGQQKSQDVLRAELEVSLLDDRLLQIAREIETAKANLERLIGSAAARPLPNALPRLPPPPSAQEIRQLLTRHPIILVETSQIDVSKQDINLALEQYKPSFSIDVDYGAREDGTGMNGTRIDRPDFLSAMVTMSLPIFTDKRQDKNLNSAYDQQTTAMLDRDARLLQLDQALKVALADWERLGQRISLYDLTVIRQAKDNSQSTLSAYSAGVTDFPELVRARLALLDNELRRVRLYVDRAQAQARLLFLAGR